MDDKHIFALHRYFIWADRMRVHFDQVLKAGLEKTKPNQSFTIDEFLYMSYWYGGMYVVIEGWKDLGLSDPEIDNLLNSPNVDLLRRYRNGTFHFQRDYFDERFIGFMKDSKNSVQWIRELRKQFSRFFLDWLKRKTQSDS
jgi:hypothetical protein